MCNFIMIMILLVTAYNGMWEQGRQAEATHGYSKHHRRPRVRTASGGVPAGLPAMPCWRTQHRTSAISTRRRMQQGIATGIIE